MKSFRQLFPAALIATALVYASCDDSTDMLGVDIMPNGDFVTASSQVYGVQTQSYAVGDHILSRTPLSSLGRFTDPETETVLESDFLAQFQCAETFGFPDVVVDDKITSVELRLFVDSFIGDSLAPFKLSIYPLNKILDANDDFYTDINPADYYDETAEPLAVKWFTLSDRTISDTDRATVTRNIQIDLPTSVGQAIYDDYRAHPEHYANTQAWMNSGMTGCKGFYFKLESGDGAMAYIQISQLNLYYKFYDEEYAKDTLGITQFASTSEVVQATRLRNSHLDRLLAETDVTYVKSPAGIFTMATLPVSQLSLTDSISLARMTFQRYNDKVQSAFKLSVPSQLLMVRLDDYLNGYFEDYSVPDSETSFLAAFNESKNTYEFSNIARLLTAIQNEIKEGTATANADKVLLIPVTPTYDTGGNVVRVFHDFSMSSAKLVGGTTKDVDLTVIYSTYNQ